MCARHTITSGKYVFPTRSLRTYLWSPTYSSTVKDIFRSTSVEIGTDISLGKALQAWCFSPCWGCKTIISCQNGMKRLQGFVLTVQSMVTCTYHLNSPAAVSIYGWRYQARHHCAYVMGCLACFAWGTTFYFRNRTASPLCKLFGNIAASSPIHLLPILLFKSFSGPKPLFT